MKNLFILAAVLGFAACTSQQSSDTTTAVDTLTVVTDSTMVVDTTATVDTTAVDTVVTP